MLRKTGLLGVAVMLLGFSVFPLDAAPHAWCRDCEAEYNACAATCQEWWAEEPESLDECRNRCGVGLDACLGQICEDEG